MVPVYNDSAVPATPADESLAYIRQMLGELRGVADEKGADMLCYLLEMAYVEAGDLMSGRRALSVKKVEGNAAAGVPVQPAGKIKL
ncbi:hypothetical protein [Rhizobium sp. Leaf371]|uniref:hypothetical protein n=1 Tax=Rhizobium sp. Leaf371 TaxID=1736355 RepID=UPI0009EB749E|nr:hypothetical protein [Rhizobium sp. Leaf371]